MRSSCSSGRASRRRLPAAALAMVVALGLVGGVSTGSAAAGAAAVPTPSADPFYTPPAGFASSAPGTVLRWRRVTLAAPQALVSSATYQLLYRTTNATGAPIATVTTLLLPAVPAPGPRKLLSYQTAEDSLTTNCAPSYTMRSGSGGSQHAEDLEITTSLLQGWAVLVPDYQGPQSEYAVGPLEGRATLDSVRAAERFALAGLDGTRTRVGMIGYSGGSIPSLWANALAPSYAPELNIVGVAAGGIPADPIENLNAIEGSLFFSAIIAIGVGIDRAYPQLGFDSLLNSRGQAIAASAGRDAYGCAGALTAAPFGRFSQYTNFPTPQAFAADPQVQAVFSKLNLITAPAPKAPSYFYNEIADEIAIIGPVDKLFAADCARGSKVDYVRDPIGEHAVGAVTYLPGALNYLKDRFAGLPAPDSCPAGS